MKTPPRLLDDPQAPPELRDDLRRAAAAPIAYDAAAGLASLQAALIAPPLPAPHGAEAAAAAKVTATTFTTAKITLAALATAVTVGTLTTLAWPHSPKHPEADVPALSSSRSAAPKAPSQVANAPAVVPVPAPTLAPAPAPAPTSSAPISSALPSAATTSLPPRALPADPDGRLRREIAQLARIKALLPARPGDALHLAQAGNREFAHGMLVQEREGIAVLALAQLGRTREASARAHSFLTRFPDSPLRERIALIAGGNAQ
jgi:hypothetical protein